MVVVTSLQEGQRILAGNGPRDWEVIVTYDTRPATGESSRPYFDPLNNLKEQWASGQGSRRMYMCLFGKVLFSGTPDVWVKVKIMRRLINWPRVAYCAWADSDATIVPYFAARSKDAYENATLSFPRLSTIFQT